MAKLLRKKRSKTNKIKNNALALACLLGMTTNNFVQAQIPEIFTSAIPTYTQTVFGDVDNPNAQAISFKKNNMSGINFTFNSTLDIDNLYADSKTDLKYFVSKPNFIKAEGSEESFEITQDFNQENISSSNTYEAFFEAMESQYSQNSTQGGFITYDNFSADKVTTQFINIYKNDDIYSSTMNNARVLNDGDIGEFDATFVGIQGLFTNYGYGPESLYHHLITNDGLIETLKGDFIANSNYAIYNTGTIEKINANFIGNGSQNFHPDTMYEFDKPDAQIANHGEIGEIVNSNFINNLNTHIIYDIEKDYVEYTINENPEQYLAHRLYYSPAAIYTESDLTISAKDGGISIFKGNGNEIYIQPTSGDVYEPYLYTQSNEAIFVMPYGEWSNDQLTFYMDGETSTLTLNAESGGKIVMDDKINGFEYDLKITGDETGAVYINDKVNAINVEYNRFEDIYSFEEGKGVVDISLDNTNLILAKGADVFDGHNLTLNSGSLSLLNNQIGQMSLKELNVAGDIRFYGDVDLANKQIDRISAQNYTGDGNIIVAGLNMLSDFNGENTEILFADEGLKDNIISKVDSVAYTPIYKYGVKYDERNDAGYFVFSRGSSNDSNSFNPAILGSSTAASAGAISTMNNTFNYAFSHSDSHMHIPYLERVAMRNQNKYALSTPGDAADVGRYSPLYHKNSEARGIWFKPYATFERVPLKNGPKVDNISYGTLLGYDSELKSLGNGWDRVLTGYLGYNGARQDYSGVDSNQNGGLLGGTMTFYKDNFFNATTLSFGASVAKNQTMYGNEDFTMLLGGIGNKTGYNFEFKDGKIILQPSLLLSYTFVNTFDYTNAAGIKMESDPLHILQIAPGFKIIGNTENGWQPYLGVNMVWNIGESSATANGVALPEMSINPYVQYGVGLQKRFQDKCTAYGQAMVQNGGRNGVSLIAGIRYHF
ncbi:hypothetical protein IJ425_08680 [bacterium]|nr:hypothetical protein [bacterium]